MVVDTPGRIAALQTGKADITIANFTNTLERSTAIAFTRPYVIVGSNYMVKRESALQTVEQANKAGIKVAVPRGGTGEGICQANTPNAEMVRFNTVTDAFLALKSGQVDTQVLDSLQDSAFLSKESANFRNLPGNYSYEEIAIGLPAGDADWFRICDAFVRQLVGSGEDAKLFKKWFGYPLPPL
jgi:polar amino acid transport system substrate-binding protein